MGVIDINPIQLPGEPAVVAIAGLFQALVEKAPPEQVAEITNRFLEITAPYHRINVAISNNLAAFLGKILHVDKATISIVDTPKLASITALPPPSAPPRAEVVAQT